LAAVPSFGRAAGVERSAARGADAASDLYERYSAQIFGYCLHQLGSREEAEDAVQTTFMNAFRGLQRGIVPELESAWLFKIAHNVCLSRRRSSWRRGRVEAPNNLEVLQEVVPARERIGDELIRLQDVLEEMPDNQRRAILLREWQGLTYREIAGELAVSQSAVETLIFRARRALAAGLGRDRDRSRPRRARHAGDAGAVVVALKTLLSGGGAAKLAVAALIAAASTIAAPVGSHHRAPDVRHAAPRTTARVHMAPSTPASRRLASVAPTLHHAAPPAARPEPRLRPIAPEQSTPALTSSPAGARETPPATQPPAPAAQQPSEYKPSTPAPPESSDAPGKAHENQPAPPAADPPQPSADQGEDAAAGRQDNPGKGNGHSG